MIGRRIALSVVLAVGLCGIVMSQSTPRSATAPNGLTIRIGVPEPNIPPIKRDGWTIHVALENTSDQSLRIFDEWNSFGYFNLGLDYELADGSRGSLKKIGRGWRMNFPSSTILRPGQLLVRDVYLDPAIWSGLPDLTKETAVTFTATFAEHASEQENVWTGIARSLPVEFHIRQGSGWTGDLRTPGPDR
jgi:hypothetical protein